MYHFRLLLIILFPFFIVSCEKEPAPEIIDNSPPCQVQLFERYSKDHPTEIVYDDDNKPETIVSDGYKQVVYNDENIAEIIVLTPEHERGKYAVEYNGSRVSKITRSYFDNEKIQEFNFVYDEDSIYVETRRNYIDNEITEPYLLNITSLKFSDSEVAVKSTYYKDGFEGNNYELLLTTDNNINPFYNNLLLFPELESIEYFLLENNILKVERLQLESTDNAREEFFQYEYNDLGYPVITYRRSFGQIVEYFQFTYMCRE